MVVYQMLADLCGTWNIPSNNKKAILQLNETDNNYVLSSLKNK